MELQQERDGEEQTPGGSCQSPGSHAMEDSDADGGAVGGAVGGARPKQWPTPVFSLLFSDGEESATREPRGRSRPAVAGESTDRRNAPRPTNTRQATRSHEAVSEEEEEGERPATWWEKIRGNRPHRPATRRKASGPRARAYSSDEEDREEEWHDAAYSLLPRPHTPETRRVSNRALEERIDTQGETLSRLMLSIESMNTTLRAVVGARAPDQTPASPEPATAPSSPHPLPSTPPRTERRITVPLKIKGYNGLTDLEAYLAQVEAVARGNRWSNADTAHHVLAALDGEGRDVIGDVEPAERENYEYIVTAMRRRFGLYSIEEEARSQLARRHRQANETVGKYGAVLIALSRRGWPAASEAHREDILLRAFLDGLRPLPLRAHVRLQRCKSMAAALLEANEADTVMREEQPTPRANSPKRPRVRGITQEEEQLEEEECRGVTSLVCRRCQGIGHRAAECDAPVPRGRPPCARCGGVGHSAVDCREPRIPPPALNTQGKVK